MKTKSKICITNLMKISICFNFLMKILKTQILDKEKSLLNKIMIKCQRVFQKYPVLVIRTKNKVVNRVIKVEGSFKANYRVKNMIIFLLKRTIIMILILIQRVLSLLEYPNLKGINH